MVTTTVRPFVNGCGNETLEFKHNLKRGMVCADNKEEVITQVQQISAEG